MSNEKKSKTTKKPISFKDLEKTVGRSKNVINVAGLKKFLSGGGIDELYGGKGKTKTYLNLSDTKFKSKLMKMMEIKPTRGGVGGGNIFSQFGAGRKGKAMKKNPFDLNKGGMAKKKKMAKGGVAKKKT